MALTVVCKNPACPELDIPKVDLGLADPPITADEIYCGKCGSSVVEIPAADEDTPTPTPSSEAPC